MSKLDKKADAMFKRLWKEFKGIPLTAHVFNKAIRFYGEACHSISVSNCGCILLCRASLESLLYTLLTRDPDTWNEIESNVLKYSNKGDSLGIFIKDSKNKWLEGKLLSHANYIKDRGNYVAHIYQHIDRNDKNIQEIFNRVPDTINNQIFHDYIMENLEWVSKKEAIKVVNATRKVLVGVLKQMPKSKEIIFPLWE